MDDKSKIERLQKQLYSRNSKHLGVQDRRELREVSYDTPKQWSDVHHTQTHETQPPEKKSLLSRLLVISGVFFVMALGLSLLFFFGGANIISSKNIEIKVEGPTTIGGGEELILQLSIVNRNSVSIKLVDLLIEYPEGTRSADNLGTELPRFRESIGTLRPGERVQKTVRAVLFGEENSQKDITVTIEYRIDGSNAIFFAEKKYQLTISSSPLSLSISSLKEITSGQKIELSATITSNSTTIIENVLLVVEYPFGFEFESASPEPTFGGNVWELGDIKSGGKRTVRITGTIIGEDEEERVFRFSSGIQSEKNENKLEAAFITFLQPIIVKKPFISVDLALNGNIEEEYVFRSGQQIRVDVIWFNNLPDSIADAEIELKILGNALDKFSVNVDRGFYQSINNTISWSRETDSTLALLSPGQSGRAHFSFRSLSLSSGVTLRNPEITFEISVKGKRISSNQVPERIISTLVRTIKISSDLLLSARAVYFSGPFSNTGPIPPKVNVETTYTVIWIVTNVQNAVAGTKVIATIPSYIRWMGTVIPSSESVTFNSVDREIVWNVGEVEAGGGSTSASQREVSFQVALIPSISQFGGIPVLINQQTVSGFDRFAEVTVEYVRVPLTTRLSSDPSFPNGGETVIQ